MKLDVRCSETNRITLVFNDNNTIDWIQRTNATVEWAGQIANKISYLFPEYKLHTFGFVPSSNGGYMVTAHWQLNG